MLGLVFTINYAILPYSTMMRYSYISSVRYYPGMSNIDTPLISCASITDVIINYYNTNVRDLAYLF